MPDNNKRRIFKAMATVTQLGLDIVTPLVLCLFFTNWLIRKFTLNDRWMLLAIIVGVVSGFLNLIKFIKNINEDRI